MTPDEVAKVAQLIAEETAAVLFAHLPARLGDPGVSAPLPKSLDLLPDAVKRCETDVDYCEDDAVEVTTVVALETGVVTASAKLP
ncbi:hypothetical protein H7J07_05895 [Mycobacterium koreense]|uniref:Uncharacterized protein n=1 Tax=Mycolicibacillus koreensis TaxID=1069220 RepID=A0AA91PG50_9MYCO|nr:hypothetical protein [Mycolicibacillus koreensis]MCV7247758.1 hypothetical protein [Mycolicibacillus koreensis]OSC34719.1 hypothetical protein B8W67_05575 [Mycolicibacillus koreensis]